MIIKKMHKLPTRTKAFLLLILGLVIGLSWPAITSNLLISQRKFMFDMMMLLTFISTLIWTIRKRRERPSRNL